MSTETADILDEAANVIERNGFHKDGMFRVVVGKPAEECPVCTWGALAIAACGTPFMPTNRDVRVVMPVADALATFLGLNVLGSASMWSIPDWNDAEGRTAEQAIAALRGAAKAEREAGS